MLSFFAQTWGEIIVKINEVCRASTNGADIEPPLMQLVQLAFLFDVYMKADKKTREFIRAMPDEDRLNYAIRNFGKN